MNEKVFEWIFKIITVIILPLVVYLFRLIQSKADTKEIDQRFADLSVAYKEDKKYLFDLIKADKLILDSCVTQTNLLQQLAAVTGRADDKTMALMQSVVEMKVDIRQLGIELAKTSKELDALPARVANLESKRDSDRDRDHKT